MTRYGTIIGTGRYVPETVFSNDMLKERVGAINPDLAKVVDTFAATAWDPPWPA